MQKVITGISFFILFVICGIIVSDIASQPNISASTTAVPTPTLEADVLDNEKLFAIINNWRIKNGYNPYLKDERVCAIAKDRADDDIDLFNKDASNYGHTEFLAKYNDYPYVLSENLTGARNRFSNKPYSNHEILEGWLNSPPHRKALEADYKYSCVVCDKQCVQIFSNLDY